MTSPSPVAKLDPKFLTVAEVASVLRVSKMTVYRMIHAGDLPAVQVGRSYRVAQGTVDQYLKDAFVTSA